MRTFRIGLAALASYITLNFIWSRSLFIVSLNSDPLPPIVTAKDGENARDMVSFFTDTPPVFLKNYIDQDFIILVSAFVDYRYLSFNSSGPLRVTINAVVNKKRLLVSENKGLVCIFRVHSDDVLEAFNSSASVKLSGDDHSRPYNPAAVECILPEELHLFRDIQVSIGYKEKFNSLKDMPWLNLIFNLKSKRVATNTSLLHSMNHSSVICVPPIRGDLYKDTIVEWIEFYRIIGVSHFVLYDHSIGPQTSEILKQYENKGTVSIIPWKIPSCEEIYREEKKLNQSSTGSLCTGKKFWVHYYGQHGAVHDCLLRAVGFSRWIGFLDIDEYVLPRIPNVFTLQELFQNKSSQQASVLKSTEESLILSVPGFHFLNQFSFPECKAVPIERFSKYDIPLKRRNNLIGTSTFLFQNLTSPSWSRSKVFLNPLVIKRHGIHIPESIFDEVSFPSNMRSSFEKATGIFAKKKFLKHFIYLAPDEAIMLHMRKQRRSRPTCSLDLEYQTRNSLVNDSTIVDKYGDKLIRRVVNFYEQLNTSSI